MALDFNRINTLLTERLTEARRYDALTTPLALAAALNVRFRENDLLAAVPAEDRDITWLRDNTSATVDGRWQLDDAVRRRVLAAVVEGASPTPDLPGLLLPGAGQASRDLLLLLTYRHAELDLKRRTTAEVHTLRRLAGLLIGQNKHDPNYELVMAADRELNRRELLQQFKRHTANFSGRKREMATLRDFVFRPTAGNASALLVHGVGGIGKSTLLSKFILDEGIMDREGGVLFTYLDFDRVGLSIDDPLNLMLIALRQIELQLPHNPDVTNPLANAIADLDSQLRRTDTPAQSRNIKGSSRDYVLSRLAGSHLSGWEEQLTERFAAILVVLDSFEEVQYRADRFAIDELMTFLAELHGILPSVRTIIVGRADLESDALALQREVIRDFDREAALAYVTKAGVERLELREFILEAVGNRTGSDGLTYNPLNLKLAAQLVLNSGGERPGDLIASLERQGIQEQLVRRNLDHIPDDEVRRIAFPGLLLRRINPDIIRHVLAPVGGLGAIDVGKAQDLYRRISRVSFLVQTEGGRVYFRRDLRVALRDKIRKWDEARARELITRIITYYQGKDEPEARAEYLFHHLQNGASVNILEEVQPEEWSELKPYLESALPELPAAAAAFLSRQFGVAGPADARFQQTGAELEEEMEKRLAIIFKEGGYTRTFEKMWEEIVGLPGREDSYFRYLRALMGLRLKKYDAGKLPRMGEKRISHSRQLSLELLAANYEQEHKQGARIISEYGGVDELSFFRWQSWLQLLILEAKFAGLTGRPYEARLLRAVDPDWLADRMQSIGGEDWVATNIPYHYRELIWEPLAILGQPLKLSGGPAKRLLLGNQRQALKEMESQLALIHTAYRDAATGYGELIRHIRKADPEHLQRVFETTTSRLPAEIALPGSPDVQAIDLADHLIGHFAGFWPSVQDVSDRLAGEKRRPAKPDRSNPVTRGSSEATPPPAPYPPPTPTQTTDLMALWEADDLEALLPAMAEATDNERTQETIILLRARLARLNKDIANGTRYQQDTDIERARIRQAAYQTMKEI